MKLMKQQRIRRGALGIAAIAVLAGACGGDDIDLPVPAAISVVDGTDGQVVFAGAPLPAPLTALVTDAAGVPVPRGEVRWSVTGGAGASLSDSVTQADASGEAVAWLTLGTTPGAYTVRAELVNDRNKSVAFSATATQAPSLTSLVPGTFTGGDTVTLQGSLLADTLLVEIGGEFARVLSATPAGDAMNVVAPRCLVPGSVNVAVSYAGAQLDAVAGTYQAAAQPLQLEVGEYSLLDPLTLNGCATFPVAGPAGAEYLFTPQSAASIPGLIADYRFRGNLAAPPAVRRPRAEPEELPFAVRFHDFLREREAEIARMPKPARAPDALGPMVTAAIEVGDLRDFRVCAALPCGTDDFVTVRAEARYAGLHAAIYEDLEAPGTFTDADFAAFGELFDDQLYEVTSRAFGSESDVDRNGLVMILMTPVVNGFTPEELCGEAIITGFFFAPDIDPAFENDNRSNQAEVFYSMTPDPDGTMGCPVSNRLVGLLVPVTFVHEFQHMISYNQHVLVRGGDSEDLWLNEGLSHLSEELVGEHLAGQGEDLLASQFVLGDLFNGFQFLEDPGSAFMLFSAGTGTLAERGGSWLFLRWLVDQFGDGVTRRLVETAEYGAVNVEDSVGEPFSRLVSEWFLANYVSDLPGLTAPARLTYSSWDFRETYGLLNQQLPSQFPSPFPIVPQRFSGGLFNTSGQLHAGSGDYYIVEQTAGESGFTVELVNPAGGPLTATIVARLNVIRIQ